MCGKNTVFRVVTADGTYCVFGNLNGQLWKQTEHCLLCLMKVTYFLSQNVIRYLIFICLFINLLCKWIKL